MAGNDTCCQVAIIGAGPYGLAAAAHLRAAKVETRTFGSGVVLLRYQRVAAGTGTST